MTNDDILNKLDRALSVKEAIRAEITDSSVGGNDVGTAMEGYPGLIGRIPSTGVAEFPQWFKDSIVTYYDAVRQNMTNAIMSSRVSRLLKDYSGNGLDMELIDFKWTDADGFRNGRLQFDGTGSYGHAHGAKLKLTDYTVMTDRINDRASGGSCFASKSTEVGNGAFILEVGSSANKESYSYGKPTVFEEKYGTVYMSKSSYDGKNITPGTIEDNENLFLGVVRPGDSRKFNGSFSRFLLFSRTLTDEEREWVWLNIFRLPQVHFDDPEVDRVMTEAVGTSGRLTQGVLDRVTRLPSFQGNKVIVSFDDMWKLRNVKIIPESCFQDCSKFGSITLSNTLEKIERLSLFTGANTLIKGLSSNLKSIGGSAFENDIICSRTIDLGKNMAISDSSFTGKNDNNDQLEEIIGVGNETNIWYGTFQKRSKLKKVTIHEGIINIETRAFFSCTSLNEVILLNTVPCTLKREVFFDCPLRNGIFVPDASVNDYKTASGWIAYADRIFPISILESGEEDVFFEDPIIRKAIEDKIGFEGKILMHNILSLRSLSWMTSYIAGAKKFNELRYFKNATDLKAFARYIPLEEVELPSTIKEISQQAFQGTHLKKIVIPEGVETLGWYCFGESSSLADIRTPKTIKTISQYSFYRCSLEKADFPMLERLDTGGLNSSGLTEIVDLGKITTIPNAFNSCFSMRKVHLNDCVTTLGPSAFYGVAHIEEINFPASLTTLDTSCLGNSGLTNMDISIPSLEVIKEGGNSGVFQSCAMSSVSNLGKITSIPNNTFRKCWALTVVTVPSTVISIGNNAFSECDILREVVMQPSTPPTLGADVFLSSNNLFAIYVPDTAVDTYKAASGWIDYADKIYPLSWKEPIVFENETFGDIMLKLSDFNGDGKLNRAEASRITELYGTYTAQNQFITKANDLKYFINLETFGNRSMGGRMYGFLEKCKRLEEFTIPSNVKHLNNLCCDCYNIKNVIYENKNNIIGMGISFRNCYLYNQDVDFPNLSSIHPQTFLNTSIKKIVNLGKVSEFSQSSYPGSFVGTFSGCEKLIFARFPDTTQILRRTLMNCISLKDLIIEAIDPPVYDTVLIGCNSLQNIYVPDESVENYKTATGWIDFAAKFKPLSTYVEPASEEPASIPEPVSENGNGGNA